MRFLPIACVIFAYFSSSALAQKASATLDQQERCATQAERIFNKLGWDFQRDSFQSHVSIKLNRCFVEIDGHATPGGTTRVLMDAYEQREYANYVWLPREGKKYWEVPPFECTFKPLGLPEQRCSSVDEYLSFTRQYLED